MRLMDRGAIHRGPGLQRVDGIQDAFAHSTGYQLSRILYLCQSIPGMHDYDQFCVCSGIFSFEKTKIAQVFIHEKMTVQVWLCGVIIRFHRIW